ncbi:MAG: DNA polymerase III subunit delta [Coriobacteriales bacterium]|jgi:DNA polymerase-3 subunit delta|nr:DNA polymerase III subunit delta [Coriobacteriales bacterium]
MATKETPLLNAYLVVGTDELKVATILQRLWTRLDRLGDVAFNAQTLDGSKDLPLTELLDTLNTPPLAAPFRLVIIRDVDRGGAALRDALTSYLASPMPTTILVMTAAKLTQQSRLYKAVSQLGSKAVIDASVRKRSELPQLVKKMALSYQIGLSHDGAARLAELVGASTIALNTEVKKLASYVLALGRSEANLEDVVAVIARSNQPSAWDFVDAYSSRDLLKALELLKALPRESPVSLLYLCVTRLRELLMYSSLAARRDGKLAKTLGKPDWQLRRLASLAERYEASELRELLAHAARGDARMKSGEDARLVLEELILASCR